METQGGDMRIQSGNVWNVGNQGGNVGNEVGVQQIRVELRGKWVKM